MNDLRFSTHKIVILSLLLSCACIAALLEQMLSLSVGVPGVKLGLGNIVVLAALYLFSLPEALMLAVAKCALTSFFAGTGFSFLYSLSGSLLSLLAMRTVIELGGENVGPIGVSVVGGVSHNIGQLLMASLIMRSQLVWVYLPVLLTAGLIAGGLIGFLSLQLIPRLRHYIKTSSKHRAPPGD